MQRPAVYNERKYRGLFKGKDLEFFEVQVGQTDLMVGAKKNLEAETLSAVRKYRSQLEAYIDAHPAFKETLAPIRPADNAPFIVKEMCRVAYLANVGPMAAVAGAISQLVGDDLLEYVDEVIVENGGDIFIKTDSPRKVSVFAGTSPLSGRISLEVLPKDSPIGICTSSGTVGPSLSLGKADAAVILSKNTFLADAVATATGNIVRTKDDINDALDFAMGVEGVEGAMIVIGDYMGIKGKLRLAV